MTETAHLRTTSAAGGPAITVRDDRGVTIAELDLPKKIREPRQADGELRAAGWARGADWTEADDGWVAPVVPEKR